jgi:hypothetical protein
MRLVKAVDYDMACNWKVYVDNYLEGYQEGLRSRTYERGRYSVRRENGVHHFHGLLHRFVVTPPTPRG